MASNYPGSLDSFDTIAADKKTSDAVGGRTHRAMHNDLGDAIEAVQAELGVNPSGSAATVVARLDAAEGRIGNLLTANQASIETSTAGWNAYNNTIARSTAQAFHGSASLLVTSTVVGGSSAYMPGGTGGAPITAGETYTASFMTKASSGTPSMYVEIVWSDSGGTYISSSSGASSASTSSWTVRSVTGVAPSSAAFASVEMKMNAGSIGDAVYCDAIGLWKGASGTWAMPGQVIPGTSHIATNGAYQTSGTAAPEGVITAPPLSRYLQTSGAATATGAMEWVKASGTGSTGWVAGAEADTGLRDVSSLLINGWALAGGGYAHIRRVGNVCELRLSLTGASASADACLSTLGTGLAPNVIETFMASSGASSVTRILHSASWGTECTGRAGVDAVLVYTVSASWPSTLPGSAA